VLWKDINAGWLIARDMSPVFGPFKPRKPLPDRYVIRGWDTETDIHGNTYLIAHSGRQQNHLLAPAGSRIDTGALIAFLHSHGIRTQDKDGNVVPVINFFTNIMFDFEGVLKEEFEAGRFTKSNYERRRVRVSHNGKTYLVRWTPRKMFSISSVGSRHQAKFYDTSNYFKGSLDSVHKELFGVSKGEYAEIDIKAGREKYSDEVLTRRCCDDAKSTAEVAAAIIEAERELGIKPRLVHTGVAGLAEEYMKQTINEPILHPFARLNSTVRDSLLNHHYHSFFGARIDIYVKGLVTDAFEMDKDSQYPHKIRELVALDNGEFKFGHSAHGDAVYGSYHVKTRFPCGLRHPHAGRCVGLLPYRLHSGEICYPVLDLPHETYICKSELDALRGLGVEPAVIDCWEYFTTERRYPFREMVDRLHAMKAEAKRQGKIARYQLVKGISVSLYGKTAQTHGRIGSLFNPIYAAEITGQSRIEILNEAQKWFSEFYETKTDSVVGRPKDERLLKLAAYANTLTKYERKKFWKSLFAGGLGKFVPKDEQSLERVNVLSGITLDTLDGLINNRGFSVDKKKHQVILTNDDDVQLVVRSTKVVRLAEALLHPRKYKPSDVNVFIEDMVKKFSIMDNKSDWPKDMTIGMLKRKTIRSKPIRDDWLDSFELGCGRYPGHPRPGYVCEHLPSSSQSPEPIRLEQHLVTATAWPATSRSSLLESPQVRASLYPHAAAATGQSYSVQSRSREVAVAPLVVSRRHRR
jgi:hypothetical protein